MNAEQAMLAIVDALEAARVPYLLVGSFSSNYYGTRELLEQIRRSHSATRIDCGKAIRQKSRRSRKQWQVRVAALAVLRPACVLVNQC